MGLGGLGSLGGLGGLGGLSPQVKFGSKRSQEEHRRLVRPCRKRLVKTKKKRFNFLGAVDMVQKIT